MEDLSDGNLSKTSSARHRDRMSAPIFLRYNDGKTEPAAEQEAAATTSKVDSVPPNPDKTAEPADQRRKQGQQNIVKALKKAKNVID